MHVRHFLCCFTKKRLENEMLTAAELDLLNTEFAKQGLASLITGIDHES